MKKRGPVSAAALAIVTAAPIQPAAPRLAAPDTLTPAELVVWRATVAALPGDWFHADQAPLLERYVRHVARAQALEALLAAADPDADLDRWAKLARLAGEESGRILALARAMRLTQQARLHPVTAGSRAASAQPARTPEDDARAVAALVAWRRGEAQS